MRLRGRRRRHTLQRVCRRYILALTCDYLANHDTQSRVRGADRPHAGRTRGDARNPGIHDSLYRAAGRTLTGPARATAPELALPAVPVMRDGRDEALAPA